MINKVSEFSKQMRSLGFTETSLAEALAIPKGTVLKYKDGERPAVKIMAKLIKLGFKFD